MADPENSTNPTTIDALDLIMPVAPCDLVVLWRTAAQQLIDAPPSDVPAENAARGAGIGAFTYCANMLEVWIKHEGSHVMMCMPVEMVHLIGVAMQFDQKDREDWKRLAHAAHACQGAGTA